jgi:hypothetical protein
VPTHDREMVEFQFVNYNDSAQTKSTAVRRFVRSHISHYQHEQKRTELGRAIRKHKPRYYAHSIDAWKPVSGPDHNMRGPSTPPVSSVSSVASTVDTNRTSQNIVDKPVSTTRDDEGVQCLEAQSQASAPIGSSSKDIVQDLVPATADPSSLHSGSHAKTEDNIKAEETGVPNQTSGEKAMHDVCPQTSRQYANPSGSCAAHFAPYRSVPQLHFEHLRDPTDELRNWVEVQRISLSSLTVRCPYPYSQPCCDVDWT